MITASVAPIETVSVTPAQFLAAFAVWVLLLAFAIGGTVWAMHQPAEVEDDPEQTVEIRPHGRYRSRRHRTGVTHSDPAANVTVDLDRIRVLAGGDPR